MVVVAVNDKTTGSELGLKAFQEVKEMILGVVIEHQELAIFIIGVVLEVLWESLFEMGSSAFTGRAEYDHRRLSQMPGRACSYSDSTRPKIYQGVGNGWFAQAKYAAKTAGSSAGFWKDAISCGKTCSRHPQLIGTFNLFSKSLRP
jgi:hypothetical protein